MRKITHFVGICFLFNYVQSQLGESFSLNKVELEGVVSGGKKLFNKLTPACFNVESFSETTKNIKTYSSREELVYEVAASVGLSIKEIDAKGSVNTKYLRKHLTEVSGSLLEITYLRSLHIVSDECLESKESELDPEILTDLAKLPYPVIKPHFRSSWRPYDAFLFKWGTHILKSTEHGAKATYHLTTTKKSTTNKKELLLKVCAKLPELNLNGCVDSGPKSSATKDSEDEKTEIFVLGGTHTTQAKLRDGDFVKEMLDQLADEAEQHAAPIKHTWVALPELLNSRITLMEQGPANTELVKRSVALLSYYKGYHLFGCDHLEVSNRNITVFVNIGSDDYPEYQCRQVMPGCQEDSDCKMWPFHLAGPCYCSGPTCMAMKKEGRVRGTAHVLQSRGFVAGKHSDNDNSRCVRRLTSCVCNKQGSDLVEVWPLGSILLKTTKPKQPTSWSTLAVLGAILFVLVLICVKLYTPKLRQKSVQPEKPKSM